MIKTLFRSSRILFSSGENMGVLQVFCHALIVMPVMLILLCVVALLVNPKVGIDLINEQAVVVGAFAGDIEPANSRVAWVEEGERSLKCEINETSQYAYCGMVMKFVDKGMLEDASGAFDYALLKHQDLNIYKWLEIRFRYHGENSSLTLFTRSSKNLPSNFDEYLETQYSHVSFNSRAEKAVIELPDIYLADWWVAKSQLPQEEKKIDLSHVYEIGIGLPVSPIAGEHQITVESIRALKPLIGWWILYITLCASICVLLIVSIAILFMRYSHKVIEENQELKVYANFDVLTECLNRRGLEQAVEQLFAARRHSTYIFIIDIDHFKRVNDTYGHDVGDKVLREVSMNLQGVLREGDIFGRWGGEEFLLIGSLSADYLPDLVQRMLSALSAISFPELNNAFRVTASIGVAEITNADNFESAFCRADKAMYSVKSNGRNGWKFL